MKQVLHRSEPAAAPPRWPATVPHAVGGPGKTTVRSGLNSSFAERTVVSPIPATRAKVGRETVPAVVLSATDPAFAVAAAGTGRSYGMVFVVAKARAGRARLARVGVVSASTTAAPTSPVAAGARRGAGAPVLCQAGMYYLVAAVIVTMWLWRDPASRIVTANPYDSDQFTWFFRYDASAVAHLRLPALTTTGMNAPQGINLMWNTPMLLPGVLLAPLTLLAGPQVSLTVLMTAGFAGSALAMFAVLRRWDASVTAAAAGGLVYGFSPALVQSAQGHYDLQFAVLPPLLVDAVLRLAVGRCGTGRRAAVRCGAWLGLLMTAQVFIAEELLFDSAVAALVLLAVLAAARPRAVAGRAGDLLAGCGAALAVLAAGAGYALWVQFFGPVRQEGSPFIADYYKNDLAGFVRPSSAMLLHTRGSAAFAAAFQGQLPEYLGYLGWPMLIAVTIAAAAFWRLLAVRAVAVTLVVLEVFSLGGTLLAGGHEHAWVKLPWYWVQTLPITGAAIPDRFSILADGAAAALFALGLDAAWTRWRGRGVVTARAGRAIRLDAGWAITLAALVAIAPIVPRPLPAGTESGVPAGWTQTLTALRLPAGAQVLVLPIPESTFAEPLRWQADTGVPSAMFGGYFMGPGRDGQAATDGTGVPAAGLYLNWLWARSAGADALAAAARTQPGPATPTRQQVRALLVAWHPAAVVAATAGRSPLGRYLVGLLGAPSAGAGGVLGWRLSESGVLAVGSRQVSGDRRGRRPGPGLVGEDGVDEVGVSVRGERGADQEGGRQRDQDAARYQLGAGGDAFHADPDLSVAHLPAEVQAGHQGKE